MTSVTEGGDSRYRPHGSEFCGVVGTENGDAWSVAVLKFGSVILTTKYSYVSLYRR